ncbi:P2Y purinoceptor 13-like isoform X2 [Genypterus blacodes]|uniref:P2Y purinoceptor 13-like isoform X2 n=1 Tax=Genypterus blacodes TaxID=154954 RepID=UPI003F758219
MSEEDTAVMTSSWNQSSVTNVTDGPCGQVSSSAHICFMLLCSLVFLVGLILNGFTMKVYFCQAQQQASSSVTIYLKNLAAADFLLCLCLPLRIANYASHSLSFQQFYCHFGASAFYLNMYASILFMGYIAANRYLKIVRPFENEILQTVRAAHIVSTVTWLLLLAMTGTYISVGLLTPKHLASVPSMLNCNTLHSHQVSVLYKIIHTCSAAIFFFVLFFLVFFYYSTSRRLSQAQQKQPASSSSKKLAECRKKMLVLEITIMLSVLNLCLDPLIYFIFSKAFRAQLSSSRPVPPTQVASQMLNENGRSSEDILNVSRAERKTSLRTMMTRRTSEL